MAPEFCVVDSRGWFLTELGVREPQALNSVDAWRES